MIVGALHEQAQPSVLSLAGHISVFDAWCCGFSFQTGVYIASAPSCCEHHKPACTCSQFAATMPQSSKHDIRMRCVDYRCGMFSLCHVAHVWILDLFTYINRITRMHVAAWLE